MERTLNLVEQPAEVVERQPRLQLAEVAGHDLEARARPGVPPARQSVRAEL